MIKKLRIKFVLINMSIVVLMLCVILGLVYSFTRIDLEQESIRMMERVAVASHPTQLGAPGEQGEGVQLPFFVLQVGPHGELMGTGGGYYDLSDDAMLQGLIREASSSPKRLGVIEEYNLRYCRVETPMKDYLVFSDMSSEQATLNGLMRTCLIIGGLSFVVFLWGSILLSKWAVRPVERAWQQQRQFVASASHELKTPLTVIMTNAELMQDPGYAPEKRQVFLESILTMSRQMKGLIEQMLELARADSGQAVPERVRLDLGNLVSEAMLPFEPVFFETGLSLEGETEEEVWVNGEEESLRQVVEILLDNARKYGDPGGHTWVKVSKRGRTHALLTVSNEGPAIPPEELPQLFKRFYRGDGARSRTGSFGLGLSIAQGIVKRHRGRIWAESRDGINRFCVELPLG